ncbi:hypothetical protein GOODEAATRI_026794, partial [Goodea atripinnis]
ENLPSRFKFKEYCPMVFRNLRERFAIDDQDYQVTHFLLNDKANAMECHGNTLLPQFLGMYRLTVDGVETYMVVTRNVFSHRLTVHRKLSLCMFQFLATLKIMDYSLLVGIHDVERAEQEEMDVEGAGEDEEFENDEMGRGVLTGSFGTPPDSPGNPLNCGGFFGPGEFDSSVDVYAIKSHDSERHCFKIEWSSFI